MKLVQISWRQYRIARQVRVTKCCQSRRIEWLSQIESHVCEWILGEWWGHGSSGRRILSSTRHVMVVWMTSWSDLLLFTPFGTAILEPNLKVERFINKIRSHSMNVCCEIKKCCIDFRNLRKMEPRQRDIIFRTISNWMRPISKTKKLKSLDFLSTFHSSTPFRIEISLVIHN